MSRTEWSGSSVSRVARMAPAEPAPTMMVSYVLGNFGRPLGGVTCRGLYADLRMPPFVPFHSSQLNRSATQANSICAAALPNSRLKNRTTTPYRSPSNSLGLPCSISSNVPSLLVQRPVFRCRATCETSPDVD